VGELTDITYYKFEQVALVNANSSPVEVLNGLAVTLNFSVAAFCV